MFEASAKKGLISGRGLAVGVRYVVALVAVYALAACTQNTAATGAAQTDGQEAAVSATASTDAGFPEPGPWIEEGEQPQLDLDHRMAAAEEQLIARQVDVCWQPPATGREPSEAVVELKLWMNRDGTIRRLEVLDKEKMGESGYFRELAESAVRDVMKCMPLKLPPDKYDQWKVFVMRFDARHHVQG